MGSGGNINYGFRNGEYTHKCEIIRIGTRDTPPAVLNIYDKENLILYQESQIIKEYKPTNNINGLKK
jgi:hypothetical protein